MEGFADFLQKNPYIIIGVFVASIIGLIASWGAFVTVLKSRVYVPGWVIFITFSIFSTAFIGLSLSRSGSDTYVKELEPVIGQDFGNEAVNIDGKRFERCKFFSTQLVFSGKNLFTLKECQMNGTSFYFAGDASITVQGMTNIYNDPAFRPQIDRVIQDIKGGNLNYRPKPRIAE